MKKLFSKDIVPNCSYCLNSQCHNAEIECLKKKHLKDGKCRSFKYNPFKRIPRRQPALPKFEKEDFTLD